MSRGDFSVFMVLAVLASSAVLAVLASSAMTGLMRAVVFGFAGTLWCVSAVVVL